MPTRKELKKISQTRLKEVKVLYNNNLFDGAKYLSGYVIETALKARICRLLKSDYPEGNEYKSFWTHNYDTLLKLSGLSKKFALESTINPNLRTNWSLLTTWNVAFRYKPIGTSKRDVEDIINALEDNRNGIFTWIRKRW